MITIRAKSVTAFATLAALLGVPAVRAQQAPTLGELALKEQERRKTLTAAARILTNEDLPKVAPPPQASKPPAVEPKIPPRAADGMGEAWWRQRIVQAREDLRRSEIFAQALQSRINALTTDFANRDDPYQRARLGEDRRKALAELDRVIAEIERQKHALTNIEEEARVAGVPPGWLR